MTSLITGHMVVKNEDRFIWYAIQSVLPFVAELLVFDTGSSDNTIEIIKSIKNNKIKFHSKKITTPEEMVYLRAQQIQMTKTNWIWIVDGDEIYPRKLSEKITETVNNYPQKLGIILHRYDLLGDIYHYQNESIGSYEQFGKKGHYVLRLINKSALPGLTVSGLYPSEYFAFADGKSIKTAGKDKFYTIEERLWHAMYLQRSTQGKNLSSTLHRKKSKTELGNDLDKSLIPEVFFEKRPDIVPSVIERRSLNYEIVAAVLTPIKKLKRQLL
jgi:glycosyltransferase involved in cell wall biosynthesis